MPMETPEGIQILYRLATKFRWFSGWKQLVRVSLLALSLCLGLWALRVGVDTSRPFHLERGRERKNAETVIMTTDTRELQIPMDPGSLLESWTITALHNHLYAKAIGAHFIYFKVEGPIIQGKRPEVEYQKHLEGYCKHPVFGWRTAHFCKLPFAWHMWGTNENMQNLVFIDSDAIFRSVNISVYKHLDQLSVHRPFGVLTNRPYDTGPCSGYWFMERGRNVAHLESGRNRSTAEDFLLEWWNEDWGDTKFQWYDQSTLRRMIHGEYPGGQIGPERKSYMDRVILLDEWQFELKSEEQLILHVGHKVADRAERLAAAWGWSEEYPLNDREKLSRLLQEIDVRVMDPSPIIAQMPLPGAVSFG